MDSKKFERLRAEAVKASKWRSTSADLSFVTPGQSNELTLRLKRTEAIGDNPFETSGASFFIDAAKNMIEVIDALSRRERESKLYPICPNCGGRHKPSPYDTSGLFGEAMAREIDKQILAELLKPPPSPSHWGDAARYALGIPPEVLYGKRNREADVRTPSTRDLQVGNRRYENKMDGVGWRRWGAKEYVGDELSDMLQAMWAKLEQTNGSSHAHRAEVPDPKQPTTADKPTFVIVDSHVDGHRHVLNRHSGETMRSEKRAMIELAIKHGSDVRPWGSYPSTFTEATR